jgi:aspartate ammonia-lyase
MMVINYTLTSETTLRKKELTSPVQSAKSVIAERCVSSIAHSVKLGWVLVNKKIISQSQLESVLTTQFRQPKKLGELLLEQKLISHKQLQQALKEQYWRRNGYWVI